MHSMASLCQLSCRCNHFTQHALLQPKDTEQNTATKRWEGYGPVKREAKGQIGTEQPSRVLFSTSPGAILKDYYLEDEKTGKSFGRKCPEQKALN